MKSYLKYIGIIDNSNKTHFVEFQAGVNIITGKSSTGKSAMIEIFDYCFGSSEFTVPAGVITDNTQLYFIVLSIKETYLFLARTPSKTKAFLKEETVLPEVHKISSQYFEEKFFIAFPDFKTLLGKYFGLDITDTDEDLQDRAFRYNNKKKGRPSIRNMTSFMLQHQNLIANKHSIFYRFDEKEKREQTIEQFKIFAGFVTQEYFITKQKLADEERNLKLLESQQKNISFQKEQNIKQLDGLLKEFTAITGNKLFTESYETILLNPDNYLIKIQDKRIVTNPNSPESLKQLEEFKKQLNTLYAQKREKQAKFNNVTSSVSYANKYKDNLANLPELKNEKIYLSECPFCKTSNEIIENEANLLFDAIDWLNGELRKSPYLLESFESDKKALECDITHIGKKIEVVEAEIEKLDEIIKNLNINRSLEEQGLKVKLKVENLLEGFINKESVNIEKDITKSKKQISDLKNDIAIKFNVERKLRNAESDINKTMKKIGTNFDFEDSYKPINLKFSLETFELWHEKSEREKIYLRSMGSGANWLYSHLCLFMAIHKYFCSLGNESLIPPILFLDQPSQVYFPISIQDTGENFDAPQLKAKEGRKEKTDEDLNAVTNLFNQMVIFCRDTLKETGIEPQIIITDHADNLELDGVEFESLVNGRRWRQRGFIAM
jgi:hypothetical protein